MMPTIVATDARDEAAGWNRDRPHMLGYGVPDTDDGLLELAAIRERLGAAKNYWVCTASGEGVPHAVPVWAAFVNDTIIFGAGPRNTRNLLANAAVTVHFESGTKEERT